MVIIFSASSVVYTYEPASCFPSPTLTNHNFHKKVASRNTRMHAMTHTIEPAKDLFSFTHNFGGNLDVLLVTSDNRMTFRIIQKIFSNSVKFNKSPLSYSPVTKL